MALDQAVNGNSELVRVVQDRFEVAIFVFLEAFPLPTIASLVAVAVVVLFFVTSSDSASFVIDMLTAGGDPDPPKVQRVFSATTEGVVAAVLLLTGGLSAMQTFQLTTGLPLALVLLAMCWSLYKALRADRQDDDLVDVARGQSTAEVTGTAAGDGQITAW